MDYSTARSIIEEGAKYYDNFRNGYTGMTGFEKWFKERVANADSEEKVLLNQAQAILSNRNSNPSTRIFGFNNSLIEEILRKNGFNQ